jgi:type IV fimbrial biogenesis protein FimT
MRLTIRQTEASEEVAVLNRGKTKGFTLFELVVTIAVAAIIVSFGIPGFTSFIQNNRAVTHTNDLVTALNLARSEATRRGAEVQVCPSADAAGCDATTDWSNGWIVRTAGGDVLRAWSKRSGGDNVVTSGGSQPIRFMARGSLGSAPADLQVRLPDCTGNQGRDVSVNAAGRIAVSRVGC